MAARRNFSRVNAVLLDIQGTLLSEHGDAYPGVPEALAALRAEGRAIRFVTNIDSVAVSTVAARLQSAQREAIGIVEEARRDAERLREELRERARAEADTLVKNAERQVQLETSRAIQQIRKEAVDLSVTIASKLLQRNISPEDNDRLIADALKQMESSARSN